MREAMREVLLFAIGIAVTVFFIWYKKLATWHTIKQGFFATFPAIRYANKHKTLWFLVATKLLCIYSFAGLWLLMIQYNLITVTQKHISGIVELLILLVISAATGYIVRYISILIDIAAMHYLFTQFESKIVSYGTVLQAAFMSYAVACKFALVDTIMFSGKNSSSRSSRIPYVSAIIGSLAGLAWDIATFFIAPVMIEEKQSLRVSIKKSVQIMKQNFGHVIGFKTGQSLFFPIVFIGTMLVLFGLFFAVLYTGKYMGIRVRTFMPLFFTILVFLFCMIVVLQVLYTISTWIFIAAAYNVVQGKNTGPLDAHFIRQSLIIEKKN
ncbi:MAG TPA: DUF6159 family protein [Candidatus Babeliales bacterium]|jgi:hypothetical protein|nr:DUF6159 family protein [Candidatus Babeliales bacterium]